jgi:microcystin-dependent protein
MEGYLAEIRSFAGNFPPLAWAFCNGQLIPIAQNEALFSLIGTIYGGDGVNTFALPNLNSRVPVGTGQGPGLSNVDLGQMAGTESVTLLSSQMPMHSHPVLSSTPAADTSTATAPSSGVAKGPVSLGAGQSNGYGAADTQLAPPSLGLSGGNQPHNNMQPFLGMNFIICVEGIYPSRN